MDVYFYSNKREDVSSKISFKIKTVPREQLQFTESCHFQNLSETKKPLNVTDLAVDTEAKDLLKTPN